MGMWWRSSSRVYRGIWEWCTSKLRRLSGVSLKGVNMPVVGVLLSSIVIHVI